MRKREGERNKDEKCKRERERERMKSFWGLVWLRQCSLNGNYAFECISVWSEMCQGPDSCWVMSLHRCLNCEVWNYKQITLAFPIQNRMVISEWTTLLGDKNLQHLYEMHIWWSDDAFLRLCVIVCVCVREQEEDLVRNEFIGRAMTDSPFSITL